MEKESNIVYESKDFYVYKQSKGFEIRCKQEGYSKVVGLKATLELAIQTIKRLEPHIDKYRKFAGLN